MFHLEIMLFAVLLFILPLQSECYLPEETCRGVAKVDCQNNTKMKKYIQCWIEKMENCVLTAATEKIRSSSECYIEEQLTTELVCFNDDCQNVSYHEYFLVCS